MVVFFFFIKNIFSSAWDSTSFIAGVVARFLHSAPLDKNRQDVGIPESISVTAGTHLRAEIILDDIDLFLALLLHKNTSV